MVKQRRLDLCSCCFLGLACLLFLSLTAIWASRGLDTSLTFDPISSYSSDSDDGASHGGDGKTALVIASFEKQDVRWLKHVPSSWAVHRYILDNFHPSTGLPVPRNRGREAMAYLTYIIDNYDKLPEYVAFVHGHNVSWHQMEPMQFKIRALNLTALDQVDYINFRCEDMAGCESRPFLDTEVGNWDGERHMRDFWDWILPGVELPRYLSFKCCGQFAVTKKAILSRTVEQWKRVRDPLLVDDAEVADLAWAKAPTGVSYDWLVGTYYEKLWHVMFDTDPENCPSVADCRQRYFSNAIACNGDMESTTWAVRADNWKDTRCITAYDNAPRDAKVDLEVFHTMLVTTYGQLQLDEQERWRQRNKAVERVKELESEVKNMTAQIEKLGGSVPGSVSDSEKKKKSKNKDQKVQKTEGKHDGRIDTPEGKEKKAVRKRKRGAMLLHD